MFMGPLPVCSGWGSRARRGFCAPDGPWCSASLSWSWSCAFNGCSFGSTPQRAIEKAIEDAEVSASGEGLFNCELVGEPLVWWDGLRFRAAVDMACS